MRTIATSAVGGNDVESRNQEQMERKTLNDANYCISKAITHHRK